MERLKLCLLCKQTFTATRKNHHFDARSCAREWRRWNKGPLPTEEFAAKRLSAMDRALYTRSVHSAHPPRRAIGYKLYCADLQLWLPTLGAVRRDGRRPTHDYYELRPRVELPRVPINGNYLIGWVLPGNVLVPSDPPYQINIQFAEDMSKVREVGRRLKAWKEQQRRLAPANQERIAPASETPDQSTESADD